MVLENEWVTRKGVTFLLVVPKQEPEHRLLGTVVHLLKEVNFHDIPVVFRAPY